MMLPHGGHADNIERGITYISMFSSPARRPFYTALISAYVSHASFRRRELWY